MPTVEVEPGVLMDSREVSAAEYAVFAGVASRTNAFGEGGAACGDPFFTEVGVPAPADDLPVVYVFWCQASAYCHWAGKSLCGRGAMQAVQSDWHRACAGPEATAFPYGDVFEPDACNVGTDQLEPVGSRPSCEGSIPGLYDLGGNVSEFSAICDGDQCLKLGASAFDLPGGAPETNVGCSRAIANLRFVGSDATGFRCCSYE